MRILRNPARPGPSDCLNGSRLPAALRAAHPQRELLECYVPADQARQGLGCNLTARTALANHAHEEVAEAVIEALDVSQHAHP